MIQNNPALNVEKLTDLLEPLIRRIVREEMERVIRKKQNIFYLNPEIPLYGDLTEIHRRKTEGKNKFYSHDEVWSE